MYRQRSIKVTAADRHGAHSSRETKSRAAGLDSLRAQAAGCMGSSKRQGPINKLPLHSHVGAIQGLVAAAHTAAPPHAVHCWEGLVAGRGRALLCTLLGVGQALIILSLECLTRLHEKAHPVASLGEWWPP